LLIVNFNELIYHIVVISVHGYL